MPYLSDSIPSLTGGVTQQVPELRIPSSAESVTNAYLSAVHGLNKRRGAEHIGNLTSNALGTSTFVHTIDRDAAEKYIVTANSDGSVEVFDLNGTAKTVNVQNAAGTYMTCTDPAEQLRATTVGDYTFFVNRSKTVLANTAADTRPLIGRTASFAIKNHTGGGKYTLVIATDVDNGDGTVTTYYRSATYDADNTNSNSSTTTAGARSTSGNTTVSSYSTTTNVANRTSSTNSYSVTHNQSSADWVSGSSSYPAQTTTTTASSDTTSVPATTTTYNTTVGSASDSTSGSSTSNVAVSIKQVISSLAGAVDGTTTVGGESWQVTNDTKGHSHDAVGELSCNREFYIVSFNGPAGTSCTHVSGVVNDFEDLPQHGAEGQLVRVTGQKDLAADDYFVEWKGTSWGETFGPSAQEQLDETTMPHVLIRESDGTFTLTTYTWDDRLAGSADSNESPSFIGREINDVFMHQSRMGLLSGESISMSESGAISNFYRTTAIQVEADERIDVDFNFGRVNVLYAATPIRNQLLLHSDKGQFLLFSPNGILTPQTVTAVQVSDYKVSTAVKPVVVGDAALAVADIGNYTQVREFYLRLADERILGNDLTVAVPQYIPAGADAVAVSRDHKFAAVHSSNDGGALYIYKFEMAGETKVQSAWSRWALGDGTIEGMAMFDDHLFIVAGLGDERELLRIDIRDQNEVEDQLLLDYAVTPTGSYYAGQDETLLNIPYDANLLTVEVWDLSSGNTIPYDRITSGGNLFVKGDVTANLSNIVVGVTYTMEVVLSTIYRRIPKKDGTGEMVMTDGRLQLQHLHVAYADSVTFNVIVDGRGRGTRSYMAGPRSGLVDLISGSVSYDSGYHKVPVMLRNDNATIAINNSTPFRSNILHVDWFGDHQPKARRI